MFCFHDANVHLLLGLGIWPIKCLFALLGRKKDGVDVGKDTSGSDGNSSQESVEFLVVLDGKGDVTGNDTALLVVTGGISGKLEDLGTEVLEDGSEVHGGTGADAGGELALLEVAGDAAHGELEPRLGRLGDGLLARLSLAATRHDVRWWSVGVQARVPPSDLRGTASLYEPCGGQ